MKINYDFYKGEDSYSDGSIEHEIIEYIKNTPSGNYNEIFKKDMRWPVFYHLTPIRENILNWYPFKENSDILEIGAGMGAITSALCKLGKSVTSVELSKTRASAIAKRCKGYDNLEIIVANLNDIKFDKKFDYITLIGVLEYAPLFTKGKNPYVDFLKNIKKLLKDDGRLLIAIENKLGMKYFTGAVEDHTNIRYDGVCGYANKNSVMTFGKKEIVDIIKDAGINNTKFYYPLPDYKLPLCMFSDECLPNEKNIDEDYNVYYYDNCLINFDEKLAFKQAIKNGVFDVFANSFFIECSNDDLSTDIKSICFDDIKKEDTPKEVIEFFNRKYLSDDDVINKLNIKLKECNDSLNGIYNSRSWKLINKIRNIIKK